MGYDVTNNLFAIASSSSITSNVRMVIDNQGTPASGRRVLTISLSIYSATKSGLEFSGSTAGSWTMGYDVSNNRFAISSSTALEQRTDW